MTELSPDATLRQGGDLRGLSADRSYLDLGTCVNRYGPPPSVAAALRNLTSLACVRTRTMPNRCSYPLTPNT